MVSSIKGIKGTMKDKKPEDTPASPPRPGPGRPRIMLKGKKYALWLDESDIKKAEMIGDGNVSMGIRIAIARCPIKPPE